MGRQRCRIEKRRDDEEESVMMGSNDDEMRLWKATKLIVEANSYERMTLWERWADKTEWQQHLQGRLVTVGTYHGRPVCVNLF
jgi:hypothetical protein